MKLITDEEYRRSWEWMNFKVALKDYENFEKAHWVVVAIPLTIALNLIVGPLPILFATILAIPALHFFRGRAWKRLLEANEKVNHWKASYLRNDMEPPL